MQAIGNIMGRFWNLIIAPTILIIFACGFMLFIYGLVEFLWKINEGGDTAEGKKHMLWGIVGMLIMVSVYGIIALLSNTFGLGVDPFTGSYNPDTSRLNDITIPSGFFK